jgi:fructose-1-phosphate kinase PfkB-like protein
MIPRDVAQSAEVESVEWEVFIEVILEFGQDSYGVCVAGSVPAKVEYNSEELILEIFSLWAEFG